MKNLIFIMAFLLFSWEASSQCAAPVLSVIGTSGETWQYGITLSPLSDGSYAHIFELCYQNSPSDSVVVVPSNSVPTPISGFSGTATSAVWYYGIKVGALFWINQYCNPNPYQMGSYFDHLYELVKDDRLYWVQSNVLKVAALPGGTAGKAKKK